MGVTVCGGVGVNVYRHDSNHYMYMYTMCIYSVRSLVFSLQVCLNLQYQEFNNW